MRCLWIMLLGCGLACSSDRALIVALDEYADPYKNLPGMSRDAEHAVEIARALGFETKVLRGKDASAANIRKEFKSWLIQGRKPHERSLFYFSGHGSFIEDINKDEKDQRDEIFLCADFAERDKVLYNYLTDDELGLLLAGLPTQLNLVFLDSCHSGTATKGLSLNFRYKSYPLAEGVRGSHRSTPATGQARNLVSLSACQDDQQTRATSQGSHMTNALIQAVRAAKAGKEKLTMNLLKEKVIAYLEKEIPKTEKQTPQLQGEKALCDSNLFKQQETSKKK
jgi:uncharacterized caspase-like protein